MAFSPSQLRLYCDKFFPIFALECFILCTKNRAAISFNAVCVNEIRILGVSPNFASERIVPTSNLRINYSPASQMSYSEFFAIKTFH